MTSQTPDRPGSNRILALDDHLIQRFVDGDLDGRERVRVEALLAADADAFGTAMEFQRQNVLLQALHPRRVEDTMLPPAALALTRRLRQVQLARRVAGSAAAILVLVAAGSLGWKAQDYVRELKQKPEVVAVFPPAPPTTVNAAQPPSPATPAAATAPVAAPMELVPATTQQGRIAVHPPNLQTVGYQLVDGRADITAYGPVIRFAYEPLDQKGGRLALTVASFGADRQSLATSINPQHTSLFWQEGKHLFALSGEVEPARLLKLVDVVTAERARQAEPALMPAPLPAPAPMPLPAPAPAAKPAPPDEPTVATEAPKDT